MNECRPSFFKTMALIHGLVESVFRSHGNSNSYSQPQAIPSPKCVKFCQIELFFNRPTVLFARSIGIVVSWCFLGRRISSNFHILHLPNQIHTIPMPLHWTFHPRAWLFNFDHLWLGPWGQCIWWFACRANLSHYVHMCFICLFRWSFKM